MALGAAEFEAARLVVSRHPLTLNESLISITVGLCLIAIGLLLLWDKWDR